MARKNVEPITFHVPIGLKDLIESYAKRHGYPVTAEYLRMLIEADMKANDEPIDLQVDRGGDRRIQKEGSGDA